MDIDLLTILTSSILQVINVNLSCQNTPISNESTRQSLQALEQTAGTPDPTIRAPEQTNSLPASRADVQTDDTNQIQPAKKKSKKKKKKKKRKRTGVLNSIPYNIYDLTHTQYLGKLNKLSKRLKKWELKVTSVHGPNREGGPATTKVMRKENTEAKKMVRAILEERDLLISLYDHTRARALGIKPVDPVTEKEG